MASRTHYTDKDDSLLVKYLAKNNPTPAGRNGTVLYKALVANAAGKWNWAKTHPWQSWRDHYVKNNKLFDARIALYQKKHPIDIKQKLLLHTPSMKNKKKQIAAEGKKLVSAKVDGGVQSDETEEEESEHSDHETVSNDGRKEVPPHPPPPQVVSVGDSANGDRSKQPILATEKESPLPNVRRKRKRVPSEGDHLDDPSTSNYFQSLPGTPSPQDQSPSPSSRSLRQPPRLIDGPFSSSFVVSKRKRPMNSAGRDQSDTESESRDEDQNVTGARKVIKVWPPRRGQAKRDHDGRMVEGKTVSSSHGDKQDKELETGQISTPPPTSMIPTRLREHKPSTRVPQLAKTHLIRQSRQPSSRTHHPFSQPSQLPDTDESPGRRSEGSSLGSPLKGVTERLSRGSDVEQLQDAGVEAVRSLHVGAEMPQNFLPKTRTTTEIAGHDSRTVTLSNPGTPESPFDPFVDEPAGLRIHKGKRNVHSTLTSNTYSRRQTFGGFSADSQIPKVDLSNPRQAARRSLSGSRTITNDHSRMQFATPQSPLVLSASDKKMIYGEGLKLLIERMSQNHGFQEDVTWRLWRSLQDLQAVDLLLKEMRDSAEKAALKIVERTGHQYGHSRTWEGRDKYGSLSSGPRFPSKLTPVHPGEEYDIEYSPPQASRAGQFSRLARQGRVKEAFKREGRRASHGGASTRKRPDLQKLIYPDNPPTTAVNEPQAPTQGPASVPEQSVVVVKEEDSIEQLPPQETVWGEEDDEALRNGDVVRLEELEKQKGTHSVRRRTVELLASLPLF